MAARLQPARWVDRQPPVERGLAVGDHAGGLPRGASPVSSIEISSNGAKASWSSATSTRSGPKPAIRNAARAASRVARNPVKIVAVAEGEIVRALADAGDADGRPLRADDDGGRAVGDGAAVVEPQRVRHQTALHHGLERHRLLEVGERVPRPVRVVLDGDQRDVPERGAGPRHPRARDEAGERGHRRPVRALVGIDRAADQLGHPRRRRCVIFSPPTTSTVRWRPAATAAYAAKSAAAPDEVAVSARRLGHPREPEVRGHVGGEVPLADELLGVHRGDDEGVGPLEVGRRERAPPGLGHEVGQRARPAARPGSWPLPRCRPRPPGLRAARRLGARADPLRSQRTRPARGRSIAADGADTGSHGLRLIGAARLHRGGPGGARQLSRLTGLPACRVWRDRSRA